MALIELYRTTGEKRFLDFAGYLLRSDRERLPLSTRESVYLFTGKPFTEHTGMEGHAFARVTPAAEPPTIISRRAMKNMGYPRQSGRTW